MPHADHPETVAAPRAAAGDVVVSARDACYARPGYASFEYATFRARAGEVCALLSTDRAAARDVLLAVAGLVRPTAGSLAVAGFELAARGRGAARPPALAVGLGVVTGLSEVAGDLTVEEAVRRELGLHRADAADPLSYLADLRLATHVDRRVALLDPPARARLSAALALAGSPAAAAVDLGDPFCAGLAVDDARAVIADFGAVARSRSVAVVVAGADPAAYRAADAVFPLDIAAREALAAVGVSDPTPFPEVACA